MSRFSPRWIALSLLSGLALSGCQTSSTRPSAAQAAANAPSAAAGEAPIWTPVDEPRPLAPVVVMGGIDETIDIAGAVTGEITRVKVVSVDGADAITVSARKEGTKLDISAPRGTEQQGIARLRVTTADGMEHAIGLLVASQNRTTKLVIYKPEPGTKPKRVFVAGKFNGWSEAANPLKDDDGDGTWQAEVIVDPGEWPYKLVVDGSWILDPANPETMDDGGQRNSKMIVEGRRSSASAPLAINVLPANVPGVGRQGGFKVDLAPGARLAPGGVALFVNNLPLAPDDYTVGEESGVISLAVKGDAWGAQQFVTVRATDSTGRMGSALAPFEFSNSPRSPKDEVIYYVVLDRFRNGDPTNDAPVDDPDVAPLNNYAGGDIAGVRQAINEGYFDDLGVTTLWISPPYVQPNEAYKDSKPPYRKLTGYHGYWPTEMRNTEPRWGTMDEFKGMVADAHKHKMAVIIDFVSNHFHQSNPLVAQHPDWFSRLELADGSPNIRLYDLHPFDTWFDAFLPDIAYDRSSEATDYMADTAVWWLKETSADGFRHDAVKHVPLVFWETCTQRLSQEIAQPAHKRLYQVGETVSSRATISSFIGPKLLDGQFDFPLFWTMLDVFAWEKGTMKTMAKSMQDSIDQYPPGAIMSPFLGNHDYPRFMSCAEFDSKPGKKPEAEEDAFKNPAQVDDVNSYRKLQLAFGFLLTIPGAPMMYYGDEIGMTGSGRPDSRRMFLAKDQWNSHNNGTRDMVRDFIKARNGSVALRRGVYQSLYTDAETMVYARIAPEETVIVALQRYAKPGPKLAIPLPAAWGAPVSLEQLAINGDAEAGIAGGKAIEIVPRPFSEGVWKVKW